VAEAQGVEMTLTSSFRYFTSVIPTTDICIWYASDYWPQII
jgi:hypothetical protein